MLTRAKSGLIIIGNRETLKTDFYWKSWLKWAAVRGCIQGEAATGNWKGLCLVEADWVMKPREVSALSESSAWPEAVEDEPALGIRLLRPQETKNPEVPTDCWEDLSTEDPDTASEFGVTSNLAQGARSGAVEDEPVRGVHMFRPEETRNPEVATDHRDDLGTEDPDTSSESILTQEECSIFFANESSCSLRIDHSECAVAAESYDARAPSPPSQWWSPNADAFSDGEEHGNVDRWASDIASILTQTESVGMVQQDHGSEETEPLEAPVYPERQSETDSASLNPMLSSSAAVENTRDVLGSEEPCMVPGHVMPGYVMPYNAHVPGYFGQQVVFMPVIVMMDPSMTAWATPMPGSYTPSVYAGSGGMRRASDGWPVDSRPNSSGSAHHCRSPEGHQRQRARHLQRLQQRRQVSRQ